MSDTRQLAIKNLKGSDEEMRVSWMFENMNENKNSNIYRKKWKEKQKCFT